MLLRTRGAVVVWTAGDPRVLPLRFRGMAEDAETQEPLALPFHAGSMVLNVGWAVLRPRPAFARVSSAP